MEKNIKIKKVAIILLAATSRITQHTVLPRTGRLGTAGRYVRVGGWVPEVVDVRK